MPEHVTSINGISARDQKHRDHMEAGSHALLCAMIRELDAMGVLHG